MNRIVAGGNYGWPTVHVTCDDDIGSERPFCQANDVVEPLATWTPTIAPSGADFYLAPPTTTASSASDQSHKHRE